MPVNVHRDLLPDLQSSNEPAAVEDRLSDRASLDPVPPLLHPQLLDGRQLDVHVIERCGAARDIHRVRLR